MRERLEITNGHGKKNLYYKQEQTARKYINSIKESSKNSIEFSSNPEKSFGLNPRLRF